MRAKQLTRRAYTVLAALLLADGGWVRRCELAQGLFDRRTVDSAIGCHIWDLQRFGVPEVETRSGVGVRLTALPADEHLDSVLACVPAVKRSAWWTTRRSRIPMTA